MNRSPQNLDAGELAKFAALAASWWDPEGPSRPLHDINPCRTRFVAERVPLAGQPLLDIGCGGGILAEALARAGARVTGIDASPEVIAAARQHAADGAFAIDYQVRTAEDHAREYRGRYAVVTCMELIEHVPDPPALLAACGALLQPAGDLFISTLNRTPMAYLQAIFGAEYVWRLLPRGTHDYLKFVRPAELGRWLRAAGFSLVEIAGMRYNPLTRRAGLSRDVGVNYLLHARVRS